MFFHTLSKHKLMHFLCKVGSWWGSSKVFSPCPMWPLNLGHKSRVSIWGVIIHLHLFTMEKFITKTPRQQKRPHPPDSPPPVPQLAQESMPSPRVPQYLPEQSDCRDDSSQDQPPLKRTHFENGSECKFPDWTGVHMQCTCSVLAVWAAYRLHWLCSGDCNYLQSPLQIYSM